MEVASTSLTTALSPYPNANYERPTLAAIYRINPLVTVPNLHLVLAPHLVSTTYKDKATTDML